MIGDTRTIVKEYDKEEIARDERVHTRFHKMVMDRFRRILNMEYNGKVVTDVMRKRMIMDPIYLMERSFVRVSIRNLYRRYRQIRIQALTEALSIVHTEEKKEEVIKKIREKIMEAGKAHKKSSAQEKEKVKK